MDQLVELKKLILDERFTSLKSLVNQEINLMSILNVAHRELQHSNFLAWLFDPRESHGKQEYFIKEFIKLYFKENNYADLGTRNALSVFDFVKLDLSDLLIKREYKNIDLLLTSESNKLVICIENKIYASEGEGQLTKYRKYVEEYYPEYDYRIYVYLSLFEQEISEEEQEHYVLITYDHVMLMLQQALKNAELSDNVEFIISQYITSLKVIMNDNSEIEKIAKELYQEYKTSFDLVWKYIDISPVRGEVNRIPNNVAELIKEHPNLTFTSETLNSIRLRPNSFLEFKGKLLELDLIPADYDMVHDKLFQFVFVTKNENLYFIFAIGNYHYKDSRQRLFDHYIKNRKLFSSFKDKPAPKWSRGLRYNIITRSMYKQLQDDPEKLQEIIEREFEHVANVLIPQIVNHIKSLS